MFLIYSGMIRKIWKQDVREMCRFDPNLSSVDMLWCPWRKKKQWLSTITTGTHFLVLVSSKDQCLCLKDLASGLIPQCLTTHEVFRSFESTRVLPIPSTDDFCQNLCNPFLSVFSPSGLVWIGLPWALPTLWSRYPWFWAPVPYKGFFNCVIRCPSHFAICFETSRNSSYAIWFV